MRVEGPYVSEDTKVSLFLFTVVLTVHAWTACEERPMLGCTGVPRGCMSAKYTTSLELVRWF